MPDAGRYAVFCVAALALLLVPGPAVLYIVTRSIQQGRRAGLVSVLGIHLGTLVHITAATAGLSALLVSSATAFTVVKLAGAAYLIGLGLWTLASRKAEAGVALGGERRLCRVFTQGVIVNVLNPKTALFFLAFLPQFVDPHHGHSALQIALLGLTFAALGMVTDSIWYGGRRRPHANRGSRWDRLGSPGCARSDSPGYARAHLQPLEPRGARIGP
jgi:threonine/homoserine/homoserine lactone efflux protein